ncbi:MAG: hypothetical protein M3367_13210 [Acidobacteriota bacterium]|nr:hypothetical protein [Acidobacteriota bacterium]
MDGKSKTQLGCQQIIIPLSTLVIVLALLVGLAWLAFQGFLILSSKVTEANFTTIATLITALISVFGALCVAFISYRAALKSKQADRQKEIEQELRKQKAPIYEEFSELLFKVLKTSKSGEQIPENELLDFIYKFNQKLLVWGGNNVIKEWANFRINTQSENKYAVLIAVEDILLAIREDMGHSNEKLKRGDLLSVFINDIGHVLNEIENEKNLIE